LVVTIASLESEVPSLAWNLNESGPVVLAV